MIDNLILLMIVSSIPLQTKPRCVWEDTAITPIIRTSYNWITWWLEVRKQYVKTLVKAVCCSVSSTFYDMNLLKLFHGELLISNWCYFLFLFFCNTQKKCTKTEGNNENCIRVMIKNNVHPLFQIHINVYNGVLYNTCSCFCLMYCLYFVLNKKLLLFHFFF